MSAMRSFALAFLRLIEHRGPERRESFGHHGRLLVRGRRKDQFAEALRHHRDHFGEVGRLRAGRDILVDQLVDLTMQALGHDALPRKLARLPACNIGGPALIHYCARMPALRETSVQRVTSLWKIALKDAGSVAIGMPAIASMRCFVSRSAMSWARTR